MRNVIYLVPYDIIQPGMRIGLLGAGNVGEDYYQQLGLSRSARVVAWMDSNPLIYERKPGIVSVEDGLKRGSDRILLAVFDEQRADEMKRQLVKAGVEESKIIWKKPEEIDLIARMSTDPFLSKLCIWREKKYKENQEHLWDIFTDLQRFLETYRKILFAGNYDNREWYLSPEKKVAYLLNAKVACTSIKASVIGTEEDMDRRGSYEKYVKMSLDDPQIASLVDCYKFTLVRNPFARLASCYKNKFITDKKQFHLDDKDTYFNKTGYLMKYFGEDKGFCNFARKVCQIPVPWQDRHFRLQYDLIYQGDSSRVDYIGRFEELPDSFEPIRKRFNLSPLKHYNYSGNEEWMDYYDVETACLVYHYYEKDIKQFGYENEYYKLIDHCEKRLGNGR